ncbi:MAG: PAS domain S-box protein, partial [Nitrospira sp.]
MGKADGVNGVPTHILMIEDNPGDARILRELLAEAAPGRFKLTHVDRLATGITSLREDGTDLVLLDLSLPDSHGFATLFAMHKAAKNIPIVVMTGVEDESLGLQLIQQGAQDYLVKGQVTGPLLQRSLRYALERARMANELRQKTTLLQSVLDSMADGVVMANDAGAFQLWNPAAERIVGTAPSDVGTDEWSTHFGLFLPNTISPYPAEELPLVRAMRGESVNDVLLFLTNTYCPSGAWLSVNARPLRDESGRIRGGVAVFRDVTERKRAEEAFLASEARFSAIMDHSPSLIFLKDTEGRYLQANRKFADTFHLNGKEIIGRTDDELFPAEQAAAFRANDRQVFDTGLPTEFEEIAVHDDGLHTSIVVKFPLFTPQGQCYALCGMTTDITERKRAEEALLESEGRLRSIVQSTGDAIILMDTEGQVAFWNNGAEKTFGYTAKEMVGQPMTRIIPERFREAHQRGVQRVAAAGKLTVQASMFELVGLRKDGTEFPLEFSLAAWTAKSTLFITGIIRDISERVKAEEALRASEARFKAIMDYSPSMIFIKDAKGRYLQVNRRTEKTLLLTGTDIVGKTDDELFPLEQASAFQAHDRQVLETGVAMEFEETAILDNEPRTYIVVKFPLFSPQGTCYGLCGMTTDITERKRAEETLHRSEELLRSVINNATAAIYAKQADGRYLMVNSRFEQLFHFTSDQVCGKTDHDIFPKEMADMFRTNDRWVLTNGRPLETEEYVRHADGLHTYLSVKVPIRDQAGHVSAMCGISTDITERKRAEEERQRLTRERLLLLDSTGDGIYGIDPEGRCTFINKAGAKMLGYEPDEVRGKHIHRLIHHSLPDRSPYPITQCHIYEVLHSGQGCHIDDEVLWRKDGTAFPADYSSSPILEQNRITGAVVTFIDITVRKRLEQERSQRA